MKKSIQKFTLTAATLVSISTYADPVILKIAHFLPPTSGVQVKVIQPWCDTIQKESAGQLKCQIYPAMQLGGTPAQLVDQVKNGVADIVWTAPGYSAGRFPTIEAMELPFVVTDAVSGSKAAWAFYQKNAQKEFDAYKVLALHVDGGMVAHTARKPISNMASLAGLKLRASTRMVSKLLQTMGATPVNMPPAQVTEAISKGVVDGAMASWEVVMPTKLAEVAEFHTEPAAGKPIFSTTVLSLLMNKQKYNSLPANLKAIIDKNSGAPLVANFGKAFGDTITDTKKQVAASKGKIIVLAPTDYDAMRKTAQTFENEWIKDVTAKGMNGKQLAADAHAFALKP
ncbi:TRAP transporter substrate-binding protein [Leeia sp. TBRC 13508]|uniref:TRAP transporter substrate-binding protein n=1 Tax=Leeia speluncae TaxID=2884804 RepID=A0ABS8D361_9NEIS|nr:TRAP transporter substrate-binding protein [Leeia speluncae]MCB6182641.1 TRAP transporter substrate-binding protein [Leeia speluncae]